MEENERTRCIMNEATQILCSNLDVGNILRSLKSALVLSEYDVCYIKLPSARKERVNRMLAKIEEKGVTAYEEFMKALEKHDKDLYGEVRNIEKKYTDESERQEHVPHVPRHLEEQQMASANAHPFTAADAQAGAPPQAAHEQGVPDSHSPLSAFHRDIMGTLPSTMNTGTTKPVTVSPSNLSDQTRGKISSFSRDASQRLEHVPYSHHHLEERQMASGSTSSFTAADARADEPFQAAHQQDPGVETCQVFGCTTEVFAACPRCLAYLCQEHYDQELPCFDHNYSGGETHSNDTAKGNPLNLLEQLTSVAENQVNVGGTIYNFYGNVFMNDGKQSSSEVSHTGFIEKIAKQLKTHYLNKMCTLPLHPWERGRFVDLDDIYVRLTMDIEIPKPSKPIKQRLDSYHQIFSGEETHRRFVLEGRPGLGKTTVCAKIAYDWAYPSAKSPLEHITLLFILKLGSITHESNVEEEIHKQLLPSLTKSDLQTLWATTRELGESVVLVLDALDEADPNLFGYRNVGNIVKTITYDDSCSCRILITTRPWRVREITDLGMYRHLELQGFTKSDILEYVDKFFIQSAEDHKIITLGVKLQQHIRENKLLVDASVPLIALLICWYWQTTGGKEEIPNRIGCLYDDIIDIMYNSLSAEERETIQKDKIISHLGQLAAEGLTPTTTKIVFPTNKIKKSCGEQVLELSLKMGIMCVKGQNSQQFFHKSGQEFCCGAYIGNNLEKLSSYLELVKTAKDALRIAVVLIFASRFKIAATKIVKKLLGIFQSEIKPHISLYYNNKLSVDDMRTIQQFIELCLECNFEADLKAELTPMMADIFMDGNVLFNGITSKSAVSLAYCMTHCNPDDIRHFTLHPVAHASDPFINYGPTSEIWDNAMQSMKSLSHDKIEEIVTKFKVTNQNLNEEWKEDDNPTFLAAYIPCIQAWQGQPSSSETNILPIIHTFKHVKLKTLNVSHFKLGNQFDSILDCVSGGHMQYLVRMRARSTALTGQQITKLCKSIDKMPLLRTLDISYNEPEAGQSIPILARNISKCPSLQRLFVSRMSIPADDMEALALSLPSHSQLIALDISYNKMNNKVASCLIDKLPQTLVFLHISVDNLSRSKHNELLQTLSHKLTRLQHLRVYRSQYVDDLVKHAVLVLTKCNHLNKLVLTSPCNELIPMDCVEIFTEAIQRARNIKMLRLHRIFLDKEGFVRLMQVCREKKHFKKLMFDRRSLPEDVDPASLDDFIILS